MQNDNTPALTMEYLLGKIDQIASDTSYLRETIAALQDMKSDPAFADNMVGDNAGAAKAQSLGSAIMCRETTNQQLLALYKQMYKDMRSVDSFDSGQLRQILEKLSEADEEKLPYIESIVMKVLGV